MHIYLTDPCLLWPAPQGRGSLVDRVTLTLDERGVCVRQKDGNGVELFRGGLLGWTCLGVVPLYALGRLHLVRDRDEVREALPHISSFFPIDLLVKRNGESVGYEADASSHAQFFLRLRGEQMTTTVGLVKRIVVMTEDARTTIPDSCASGLRPPPSPEESGDVEETGS